MRRDLAAREIGLRPLTARSVVLSLLLGAHPPELPVRDLVRTAEMFDISDATLRVALTRMVAAEDLRRTGSTYGLSDRLVRRQRRQDEAVHPETVDCQGEWETVVVTATGRSAADRGALRATLIAARLAELREGVWMRPANLRRSLPDELNQVASAFDAHPHGDPATLANTLWDLSAWSTVARALLGYFDTADHPADRFTVAAATVRHLLADPVLPESLLPENWPGAALRRAYEDYQAELIQLGELARS